MSISWISKSTTVPPPANLTDMSFLDDGTHEHGGDTKTSVSYALANVIEPLQMTNNSTNRYSNCALQLCLYLRDDGNECLEFITCGSVPEHFRDFHAIRNMARDVKITCRWPNCGCWVQRHNFVRHIREVHLGHGRRVNQN
ncbi:hypothetical protein M404DRAFT_845852 [Pisolithus tinctorius Marx 270]|uniref:Uncharacterized protein n=1 Tax=Pisolithus tinctorius Marx 270 TaxID=870435 RepID=A0A0C3INW0_PISTI|nr:hypothetical protein M404DRAFT_845852 [Pisolithus tinctorius Marx 270]